MITSAIPQQKAFLHRSSVSVSATAIPFIYSFSGNCAASAAISTFMCLCAINIFPGSVHIFPQAEKADPSWEYIIRSQKHECGNWDWGPDIPFLGKFVSNFRHFVFAVRMYILYINDNTLSPQAGLFTIGPFLFDKCMERNLLSSILDISYSYIFHSYVILPP